MRTSLLTVAACLLTVPAFAAPKVVVPLKTSTGMDAGTATLTQSGKNVSVKLELKNLPVGDHAVHIHEESPSAKLPTSRPPAVTSIPLKSSTERRTPWGTMMATWAKTSRSAKTTGQRDYKGVYLSIDPAAPDSIFANGGTSIIVHEKADDMKTDPTGNAGNRIACGIITAPTP